MTGSDAARAEKRRLRADLRAKRRALDPARRAAVARRLLDHAAGDAELARAPFVAGYAADDGEADPGLALAHLAGRGARILLPRLSAAGVLELVDATPAYRPGDGSPPGQACDMAPTGAALPIERLPPGSVALTPCVAVDRSGVRLGRGGGHYDRLLPELRARGWRSAAVCHDDHVLPALPREPHDFAVDRILSEAGWRDIAPPRPRPRTAGIVLAGGRSARFGRPKATVAVGGIAMLDRVIAILAACCDEVVVVTAPAGAAPDEGSGAPRPGASDGAVRWLHDEVAHAGPAAALAAALPRVGAELAFVCGCDSPLLAASLVRGLLAWAASSPRDDIVAADLGMGAEPLLAAYRVETTAAALRAAARDGSPRLVEAIARTRVRLVAGDDLRVLDPSGASFLNVNRPADLAEAERRLAELSRGALS